MRLLKDEIGESESSVSEKMNEFTERSNAAIGAFMAKGPQRTEAIGRICGYDPMNQIRVGDKLLAKHFLMIQVGDKQETLTGETLVEMKEGSLFETIAYWK